MTQTIMTRTEYAVKIVNNKGTTNYVCESSFDAASALAEFHNTCEPLFDEDRVTATVVCRTKQVTTFVSEWGHLGK